MRIKSVAAAIAALLTLTALPAAAAPHLATADEAAALMSAVTAMTDAMTTGNAKGLDARFAPTSTVVDEFPPYAWTGAAAQDRWFADFVKVAGAMKMSDIKIDHAAPAYAYVDGDWAYLVVPFTFGAQMAGKPYSESGVYTYTLQRIDGTWKIVTQSWAKGRESSNPY